MNWEQIVEKLRLIGLDGAAVQGGDRSVIVLETLIDNMRDILPHLERELDEIAMAEDEANGIR